MPKHVVVLSLGAGVQSTALAIMLEQGTLPGLPKPDWALFADTRAEPMHVYETLEWLKPLVSFPIITTSWGDLRANTWRALRGEPVPERGHHTAGYIDIPIFSETGISRRQCTYVYKIRPIKAAIRELAGSKPPPPHGHPVHRHIHQRSAPRQALPRQVDHEPFPAHRTRLGPPRVAALPGRQPPRKPRPAQLVLPLQIQSRLDPDQRALPGSLRGRPRDGSRHGRPPPGPMVPHAGRFAKCHGQDRTATHFALTKRRHQPCTT